MPADKGGSGIAPVALNLALASLIAGGIVAAAYSATAPRILENRKTLKEEAMRRLVTAATVFDAGGDEGRYEARSDRGVEGYIVPVEGRGYGGTMKMIAAVGPDGALLGFELLSHNETPGLGDRAAESSFRDRFKGRRHGQFQITTTGESGKIDAISGATITSRAVAEAIDAALGEAPAGGSE
jgi:Na+-translocating ferredoxin:NAD+ oxidoreductase subunit G